MKSFSTVFLFLLIFSAILIPAQHLVKAADSSESLKISVGDTLVPFMLPIYSDRGGYAALRDYCGIPRPTRPNEPRKIVVLSFFGSTCIPCKKEIPLLQKYSAEWGENVSVLLIAVGDKKDDIQGWIKDNPTTLPIFLDPYKATTVERYGITSIPTLLVLDQDGIVQYIHQGYKDGDEIEADQQVRRLITKL